MGCLLVPIFLVFAGVLFVVSASGSPVVAVVAVLLLLQCWPRRVG